MKPKSIKQRAAELAALTAGAYSVDRYRSWAACAELLLRRGFTDEKAKVILESKWTRWAADHSDKTYGNATSKDLARFMDGVAPEHLAALFAEVGIV